MEAFVYKWTHIPSLMFYIGFHKGSPDDGYICSSRKVKPMILANPVDWKREIVAFGSKEEMYELETTILRTFDLARDRRCFNKHNNERRFFHCQPHSEETKAKLSLAQKGKKRGPMSDEARAKMSASSKGKPKSEQHRMSMSLSRKGKKKEKPRSKEHAEKLSNANKSLPKKPCIYCGRFFIKSNMTRWHGENCKEKN